jgi:MFS family permease
MLLLSAAGCLGLAFIGAPFATVGSLLIGLALGAEIDLVGYMSARYFGLKAYGTIFGCQYGMFAVGAGLGPLMYGQFFDRFGSYDAALMAAAGILLLSIPFILSLGRYPEFPSAATAP